MSSNAKTAAAKNEAKPALVPKLRFLDFRATGWIQKKLEEVAPLQRGFDLPSDLIRPGNIPIVYSNGIQKYHEVGMATAPGLVTGRSGTIGKLHFIESGDYWPHNTSLWVTSFNGNVPRFVFYLYDSIGMSRFSSGSGVPTLNRNDVHAFGVSIPSSSAEQQKVADCLSSLDELIAAQARKVDVLKTHKKGLMQQLFPREGETQPRLRFSDFKCASHWRRETIGSVASFSSGGTPSKANPEYWNGSIPWVSASSMYDLVIDKADHYVTPAAIGNGTKIAKKGSVLILVRGSMLFKRVPICIAGVDVAFNQDVKALDVDASINANFLLYQLLAFQDRLSINETGIGAGKIELDHLKGFVLFIPDSPEQQHIASFLTSLDALIADETQKLEALKTHKKGLMQQLFPFVSKTGDVNQRSSFK